MFTYQLLSRSAVVGMLWAVGWMPTAVVGQSSIPGVRPSFTVAALPDTQYYSESRPELFLAQTQWIASQAAARNIVFVSHLGDIVQHGDDQAMWANADAAISVLEAGPVIPYGLCVGNHDQEPRGDTEGTADFNLFFPHTRYAGRPWYGGHHGDDNDNSFQIFSAAGMDFVAIHLEFDDDANPLVLDWADNVLETYPNHRAIVSSHYIIGTGDPGEFSTQGQAIYDRLKGNPNLFLMMCGHIYGEARRVDVYEGNTVWTLLADYQNRDHGGDGWLRILTFHPDYNEIHVRTYSPTRDLFETDANSDFVLFYDMGGPTTVASDFDRDCDVDVDDFGWLQICLGDYFQPIGPDCVRMDLDHDDHIDDDDVSVFLNCFTGPAMPVNLACEGS